MAFHEYSFIGGEIPTVAKWNYGPENEDYLRDKLESGTDPGHTHTDSPPTGSVIMWAAPSGSIPSSFLQCNGQAVSRSTYAALFAKIGTQFGAGNGTTTFNLPDMRDRFPVGAGNAYNLGSSGGQDFLNLSHTHNTNITHSHGGHNHTVDNHVHGQPSHSHGSGSLVVNAVGGGGGLYANEVGYGSRTTNSRITGTYQTGTWGPVTGALQIVNSTDSGGGDNTYGSAPNTNFQTISLGASLQTSTQALSASQDIRPKYLGLLFIIKA